MALQPCRECKREISDQAEKCPHCGAPVSVAKVVAEGMQALGCILTLVITLPIVLLSFGFCG